MFLVSFNSTASREKGTDLFHSVPLFLNLRRLYWVLEMHPDIHQSTA